MGLYRYNGRDEFGGRYRRIKPNPTFKKASFKKRVQESPEVLKAKEISKKTKKAYKTVTKGYKDFKTGPMIKDFWGNIEKSLTPKDVKYSKKEQYVSKRNISREKEPVFKEKKIVSSFREQRKKSKFRR